MRNISDLGRRAVELPPLVADARASEKGLRAMTMKEKLAIHKQIVKENERKLKEWKERRKVA
jgi:hypothetical protein